MIKHFLACLNLFQINNYSNMVIFSSKYNHKQHFYMLMPVKFHSTLGNKKMYFSRRKKTL